MSTPIQDNTSALRSILETANSLPKMPETPMVSVQRKTGTIKIQDAGGYTSAGYVDCGFVPDLVVIKGGFFTNESDNRSLVNAAFAFTEDSRTADAEDLMVSIYNEKGNPDIYDVYCWLDGSGFWVYMDGYTYDWDWIWVNNVTFEYVAVKYT